MHIRALPEALAYHFTTYAAGRADDDYFHPVLLKPLPVDLPGRAKGDGGSSFPTRGFGRGPVGEEFERAG